MRYQLLLTAGLLASSTIVWAQQNSCDLNKDGSVNVVDVQQATNMVIGASPCSLGSGACTTALRQSILEAALGGSCAIHSVTLSWTPSSSANVVGYNVYRTQTSGRSYTKLTSAPVTVSSYVDDNVTSGQTYYYVATAVGRDNSESANSNETRAVIPNP